MTLPFIPASLGSESFETIVSRYWRVVEGRVGARATAAAEAREAALGAPEAQP